MKVKIEKTKTGYSAFYNYDKKSFVCTTGKNLPELFENLADATKAMESAHQQ